MKMRHTKACSGNFCSLKQKKKTENKTQTDTMIDIHIDELTYPDQNP